jgi:hypothetical protein
MRDIINLVEGASFKLTLRTTRYSAKSIKMVFRDLAAGRWSRTKGPVVVKGTEFSQYQLLDGYHRALAAILAGQLHVRAKTDAQYGLYFAVAAEDDVWVFNPKSPTFGLETLGISVEDIERVAASAREHLGIVAPASLTEDTASSVSSFIAVAEEALAALPVSVSLIPDETGAVVLDTIDAHEPGQGAGGKALALICKLADVHGVTLRLEVDDDAGDGDDDDDEGTWVDDGPQERGLMTANQLLGWYGAAGFEFNGYDGQRSMMMRSPRSSGG